MMFALGFISGLLIAVLIVTTLVYFRRVIESKTTVIEKAIENKGPRQKGFVVTPTDEAEVARQKIIDKNKAQGKDTPINDLR